MKCVLASAPEVKNEGIRPFILEEIERLTKKKGEKIKVAIIIEASACDEGSQWWLFDSLKVISDTFPRKTWLCNLLALSEKQIKKLIDKVDVVWCCGGSTDFLKTIFERSGFDRLLLRILEKKVYVGSSAGSSIMGRRGNLRAQAKIYKDDLWLDVKDYLGIFDACICPHIYGRHVPENAFELICKESKKQDYPFYALSDESAIVIDGKDCYLIGRNAQKVVKGEVVERV